jgi:hypothetical protein
MNDYIIKKLLDNIKKTNQNKSSHWEKYLQNSSNFKDKFKSLGFGSYTVKTYKDIFYKFLQKIIFNNKIFNSKSYKKYEKLFDEENRFIDVDTLRHVFTFEKIKKISNPKRVCIIGDGKLNGVLGINLTFPDSEIFSINLSETLINDYIILKESTNDLANSINLVDNLDFKINGKKLYLVPSNFKDFLLDKNIDLFINIASFQEMKMGEVKQYFKIIKNNKSKLYCCNREYKKLFGGEELCFNKYPWGNFKKNFWEDCEWHQKYYSLKFPFIHKYDGNMMHCLIDYS